MSLPIISQERRKELVKLAHKYGENTKVAMRNIRRDGMDILKKMEKEDAITLEKMLKAQSAYTQYVRKEKNSSSLKARKLADKGNIQI